MTADPMGRASLALVVALLAFGAICTPRPVPAQDVTLTACLVREGEPLPACASPPEPAEVPPPPPEATCPPCDCPEP